MPHFINENGVILVGMPHISLELLCRLARQTALLSVPHVPRTTIIAEVGESRLNERQFRGEVVNHPHKIVDSTSTIGYQRACSTASRWNARAGTNNHPQHHSLHHRPATIRRRKRAGHVPKHFLNAPCPALQLWYRLFRTASMRVCERWFLGFL